MITLDEARNESRNYFINNNKIKEQEKIIDDTIMKACIRGDFGCFIEMPDMLNIVVKRYENAGYVVIKSEKINRNGPELVGYEFHWNDTNDPVTVINGYVFGDVNGFDC